MIQRVEEVGREEELENEDDESVEMLAEDWVELVPMEPDPEITVGSRDCEASLSCRGAMAKGVG